jgi:predicted DNA-binding transcriptional regulator AlpA
MADENKPSADEPVLLVSDIVAAGLCGASRATWCRLRVAGKIPAPIKLGRCVRWNRAELAEWVNAGCPPRDMWEAIKAQNRRTARSRG